MGPGWWQILIVLALLLLLFGRGKISDLMGDLAKGIKSFKSGLADEYEGKAESKVAPELIAHETPVPKRTAKRPITVSRRS